MPPADDDIETSQRRLEESLRRYEELQRKVAAQTNPVSSGTTTSAPAVTAPPGNVPPVNTPPPQTPTGGGAQPPVPRMNGSIGDPGVPNERFMEVLQRFSRTPAGEAFRAQLAAEDAVRYQQELANYQKAASEAAQTGGQAPKPPTPPYTPDQPLDVREFAKGRKNEAALTKYLDEVEAERARALKRPYGLTKEEADLLDARNRPPQGGTPEPTNVPANEPAAPRANTGGNANAGEPVKVNVNNGGTPRGPSSGFNGPRSGTPTTPSVVPTTEPTTTPATAARNGPRPSRVFVPSNPTTGGLNGAQLPGIAPKGTSFIAQLGDGIEIAGTEGVNEALNVGKGVAKIMRPPEVLLPVETPAVPVGGAGSSPGGAGPGSGGAGGAGGTGGAGGSPGGSGPAEFESDFKNLPEAMRKAAEKGGTVKLQIGEGATIEINVRAGATVEEQIELASNALKKNVAKIGEELAKSGAAPEEVATKLEKLTKLFTKKLPLPQLVEGTVDIVPKLLGRIVTPALGVKVGLDGLTESFSAQADNRADPVLAFGHGSAQSFVKLGTEPASLVLRNLPSPTIVPLPDITLGQATQAYGVTVPAILNDIPVTNVGAKAAGWVDSLPEKLSEKWQQRDHSRSGLHKDMRLGSDGILREVTVAENRLKYQDALVAVSKATGGKLMFPSEFEALPAKDAAALLQKTIMANNSQKEAAQKELSNTVLPWNRAALAAKIEGLDEVHATLGDLASRVGAALANEAKQAQTKEASAPAAGQTNGPTTKVTPTGVTPVNATPGPAKQTVAATDKDNSRPTMQMDQVGTGVVPGAPAGTKVASRSGPSQNSV